MKIVVVGLGSMGRRRIRLSRRLDSTINIIGVDSNEARRSQVAEEMEIEVSSSLDEALAVEPNGVLVCTPPLSHAAIIERVSMHNIPVFSELNLVSEGYDVFTQVEKSKKLFLSSTFLYRQDVQAIIDYCSQEKMAYIYHSGQYLPEWHPWENYKDFFVSDKRTNGCREILAIELPWLLECFGQVIAVEARQGFLSELDLDYPDTYQVILSHENGSRGVLCVDVVSRIATRHFEAYNEAKHLRWEGTPESLSIFDQGSGEVHAPSFYGGIIDRCSGYSANIVENAYEEELRVFFSWICNDDENSIRYSYAQDAATLKLIDEIEAGA